jgi:hypothetical protein
MKIEIFLKEHIEKMAIQERQKGLEYLETDEHFKWLEGNHSYSVIDGEEVLLCAGVVEMSEGRGVAWAYLSSDIGTRMTYVTRAVKRFLKLSPLRRIEMHVDCGFDAAHRWARMLGFEMECERMRSFTPDNRDCALYAMVKL